ncbi:ferric-dicitrate binding protein FerR, regulates iron transport through sigma-19 [Spirosomataceae bacterium TFI 002]|nr:ferric-dicitrate binding protein FerR, regulates iron transport through sigma-19 [Spirosomataceae bacterium TFI 002]
MKQIDDSLIARYFDHSASEEDLNNISIWLKDNPENQKELERYHKLWKLNSKDSLSFNKEKAWQKVAAKTVEKKEPKRHFWLAAAIAGVALTLSLFFWPKESKIIVALTENETKTFTLNDGSIVTLNSFSHFQYPEEFKGEERKVKITGEAFFEIAKDPEKPFIIEANGTEVKVLGTSFNVTARDQNVKVSVNTGLVVFGKKKKVILHKGEEAVFESKNDTIKTAKMLNKNVFAYKTKIFEFNNSNIKDVVDALNQGYKSDIMLRGSDWDKYALTTTFENEKLDNALEIIAVTLNLNLTKEKKNYILTKKQSDDRGI